MRVNKRKNTIQGDVDSQHITLVSALAAPYHHWQLQHHFEGKY